MPRRVGQRNRANERTLVRLMNEATLATKYIKKFYAAQDISVRLVLELNLARKRMEWLRSE
jgi:hypothetical protein